MEHLSALLEAAREVIKANQDFRLGMPADWEGDWLQDSINQLAEIVKRAEQ